MNIWSARKKLSPEDFAHDAVLPPDDRASLGSKRICDPEELRVFGMLKSRAVSLLDRHGIRFLGGWAIAEGQAENIVTDLQLIEAEFITAKETFLTRYDQSVQEWIDKHDEWERIIAGSVVSAEYVRSRIGFAWKLYRIQPPDPADPIMAGLKNEVDSLGQTLFGEVSKVATEAWHKCFAGKTEITRKALSPLRTIHQKLTGLSFVEPRVSPVADLIHTAFEHLPRRGKIEGANLLMLQGLVSILRDTAGANPIVGTSGNDTINAVIDTSDPGGDRSTFTSNDAIDGGAGTDTLNIFTTVTENKAFPAFGSVKNVEIVNINNSATAAAFGDASKFEGVQQLWQIGAATAVANLQDTTTGGFRDIAALTGDVTAKTGAASITVALDNIGEGDSASSVTTKGANTINVAGALAEDAGVFTLHARAATTSATTLTVNTAVATTLNASNAANAGVTTVDAAESAGDITYSAAAVVNVTTGSGDDDLTITAATKATVSTGEGDDTVTASGILHAETVINLGAGDDRLVLGATPAAGVTMTGGEGTDTFAIAKAGYTTVAGYTAANLAKITGFEVLEFTNALATVDPTFDISKTAGITSFVAGDGVLNTESATITGVTSGSSVTLAGDKVFQRL